MAFHGPPTSLPLTPKRVAVVTIAGLALAGLVGVFLGLSAYTFTYAEGLSYFSNNPHACVNCHVMRDQFDAWQKGSHHSATCNDCHVPVDFFGRFYTKAENGYRHSKGFTLQDFHEPIYIKGSSLRVVEANCLRCHGDFVDEITTRHGHAGGAYAGSKASSHAGEWRCTHCHAGVGHGPIR